MLPPCLKKKERKKLCTMWAMRGWQVHDNRQWAHICCLIIWKHLPSTPVLSGPQGGLLGIALSAADLWKDPSPCSHKDRCPTGTLALVPGWLMMLPAKRLRDFLFSLQPCLLMVSLGSKRGAGLGNHLKAQVSLTLEEEGREAEEVGLQGAPDC